MKKFEEGQLVLCTVTQIMGTIVFVKIEDSDIEGTITFSEISPGRIRNIRDFVFPGKKIVCKILRIKPQGVDLSLRRVKLSEKKEFNDEAKREKSYTAILKTVLKEKSESLMSKIKEKNLSLVSFLDNIKGDIEKMKEHMPEIEAEKIIQILNQKKQKNAVITKRFKLTNKSSNGMVQIKETISEAINNNCKACEATYLGAGKYMLKIKTENPKQADTQIENILKKIEEISKKRNSEYIELKATN